MTVLPPNATEKLKILEHQFHQLCQFSYLFFRFLLGQSLSNYTQVCECVSLPSRLFSKQPDLEINPNNVVCFASGLAPHRYCETQLITSIERDASHWRVVSWLALGKARRCCGKSTEMSSIETKRKNMGNFSLIQLERKDFSTLFRKYVDCFFCVDFTFFSSGSLLEGSHTSDQNGLVS